MEDPRQRIGMMIQKNSKAIDDLINRVVALETYVHSDGRPETLPKVIIPHVKGSNPDIEEPKDEDLVFIDEILKKLIDIQDQSTLLEEELKSIKEMDDQEEPSDDGTVSSVQTDMCKELLDSVEPNEHILPCNDCKQCIKQKAKHLKRERKAAEKERREYVKELKKKQKQILLIEQQEMAVKLENFRRGINIMENFKNKDKDALNQELENLDQALKELEKNI